MQHFRILVGFVVGLLIAVSIALVTASEPGNTWTLVAVAVGTFVGAIISGKCAIHIGLAVPSIMILVIEMVLEAVARHAGIQHRILTPTVVWMSIAMLLDGLLFASLGKHAHDRWRAWRERHPG